ncbi:MAG: helix-turn-helix transcriptional regulator [Armatimonadetes bacterium]|nr:helix-turn-helix transcriptional regulator [Armatimonadota bacterium]
MTIKDPAHLGTHVRQARRRLDLSQDQLAELAGVSRRPVYLLETAKGSVRVDTLFQVLDALGLTLEVKPKGSMSGD